MSTTSETPNGTATKPPTPVVLTITVNVTALAVPEPGGGYSVAVPALPGCVTEGDTIEEAQANAIEAATGWLKVAHDQQRDEALGLMAE